MAEDPLFVDLPEQLAPKRETGVGAPRLSEPVRDIVELRAASLDSLLGPDHQARLIWSYALSLDLSELEAKIKAREGVPGHPAITPRLLLALWLYATSEGVVSARLLERLCVNDAAYQWLCGGISVCHRVLGEFRVSHSEWLNRLLTQSVVALAAEGLIDLDMMAQDGIRVRASAGASSFRRRTTIEQQIADLEPILAALAKEVDSDPATNEQRLRKRRAQRAAERLSRLTAAAAKVAEIEAKQPKEPKPKSEKPEPAQKKEAGKQPKPPRVSTTDPDARVIKMPDGGFRPAYNMQITSVAGTQIAVAVDVSTSSSDRGLARPMLEKIDATYGKLPEKHLIDGGFAKNDDIEWAYGLDVEIYCPLITNKHNTDPFALRDDDGPGMSALRKRMSSDEGKAIYGKRPIHECINARGRKYGLVQLTVRGLAKARTMLTWFALVNNILQGATLRRLAAAAA